MKKVMSLVMAAMITSGLVAGCGSNNETANNSGDNNKDNGNNSASNDENNDSEEDDKKEEATGPVTYYETGGKTRTLNGHVYEDTAESAVMAYIYSNMYTFVVNEAGDNYDLVPTHAASMPEMSEDGLTWTIELRDGITFEDGTPITAETYEYSYKMLLDPALKNYRANTFFSAVEVINAEAYFNGECSWEEVGIKVDGNKIIFELAFPVPRMDFEIKFSGGGPTSPIHPEMFEKCFNEDKTENTYGTSVETTISSGPYKLTEWVRDQHKVFEKNEDHVLADLYTPDVIESRVVEEANTKLTLFESGETDYVYVSGTNYDKYEEDPRLLFSESNAVWYMYMNMTSETNPVLQDINLRKALFYAMDRDKIANDILKTALPAPYVVSSFKFVKPGVSYRSTEQAQSVLPENNGYDPELAKELFNKAYEANGSKKIELGMMYFDTSDGMKLMSELLESEYENLFGADKLDIQLQATPWKSAYDNLKAGSYDLGFGGWSGGTFNPWSSMEVFTSDYSGKNDQFKNEEFDQLWYDSVKGDLIFKEEERIDALAKMEKMLLDNVPFAPVYQTRSAALFSDRITLPTGGVYLPGVGFGELQAEILPK